VTDLEVAVVGGGPAGAIVAALLARAGHDVTVFERAPAWRWRACGVFSSPATVAALRRVGVEDATLARLARPIPAMRVETPGGVAFRLTYGHSAGVGAREPVGFDRSALDPALLSMAAAAGALVHEGRPVEHVELDTDTVRLDVGGADGRERHTARVIVGADGGHSIVARVAGVARPARLAPRVGLTFHLEDRPGDPLADARMRVFEDGYVGIAPVPGARVNVGIVLGTSWQHALAEDGAASVVDRIMTAVPALDGIAGSPPDPAAWRGGRRVDRIAGASPLGHRVTRRAGRGWLLVGDAAGFLDPFTGEGLHRAVVSAELAARATSAYLGGRTTALDAYDRAMRRRFATKDVVSGLVQVFLGQPALFEYAARRLAARAPVRETMGLVMGDLVPASRALDPRFLGALLRP
jgi:flavin-dependent dehydrogenase